jgi:hypothetical protein
MAGILGPSGDSGKVFLVSTRSVQARQALSRFGELAWFSLPAETHPLHGYPQVPYMGWRYKAPHDGIAEFLESVVRGVQTQLEWTLDRSKRNWVLLPSRILHEAQGLENPAFASTVHDINVQDRVFCLKAQSDLELIIRSLRETSAPQS